MTECQAQKDGDGMKNREAGWQKDMEKIRQELASMKLEWNIDGVAVTATDLPDMTEDEAKRYVGYVLERAPDPVTWLNIRPAKYGRVELRYECRPVRFERIRRITGYLVGTIDRWNNAKKAEERERVKHG